MARRSCPAGWAKCFRRVSGIAHSHARSATGLNALIRQSHAHTGRDTYHLPGSGRYRYHAPGCVVSHRYIGRAPTAASEHTHSKKSSNRKTLSLVPEE